MIQLRSADGTLMVVFYWNVDRFAHRVVRLDRDGNVICEIQSVEGSAHSIWPASPPIQQLSLEAMSFGPAILGVGSAGRSHWSISVQWLGEAVHPTLKFELACHCKTKPEQLGSQYQRSSGLRIVAGMQSELLPEASCDRVVPIELSDRGTICWDYSVERRAL